VSNRQHGRNARPAAASKSVSALACPLMPAGNSRLPLAPWARHTLRYADSARSVAANHLVLPPRAPLRLPAWPGPAVAPAQPDTSLPASPRTAPTCPTTHLGQQVTRQLTALKEAHSILASQPAVAVCSSGTAHGGSGGAVVLTEGKQQPTSGVCGQSASGGRLLCKAGRTE